MINVFNTSHGSFQILFWCFQNSLEEMWGPFLNNFQDVYKWEDKITPFFTQDLPKYQKCWCPHVSFSKTENEIGKWMKVFWKYSLSSRKCTERIEIRHRKCWDIFDESKFLVFLLRSKIKIHPKYTREWRFIHMYWLDVKSPNFQNKSWILEMILTW